MIDKLEFLVALAQARHFGRAAEACGVAQPTLSAGIKVLETTLGVPLVLRGARYHGLTPEGERALDWARRIVADSRALRDDLRALRTGLAGHVRIAAVPTALAAVARLTGPYRARHPGVSFTVLSRASYDILGMLDNLDADAGLTYLDGEPLGRLRAVPIYAETYCAVLPEAHPLAGRTALSWAEAARLDVCLLTPDMQNRRILDTYLRDAGGSGRATLESNSLIVLLTHVRDGGWATIVPRALTDMLSTAGVRAVPIVAGGPSPTIGLVYGARDPLSPLVAALVVQAQVVQAESGGFFHRTSGQ